MTEIPQEVGHEAISAFLNSRDRIMAGRVRAAVEAAAPFIRAAEDDELVNLISSTLFHPDYIVAVNHVLELIKARASELRGSTEETDRA
ncbi:hypothetical protein ABZ863_01740 [Saccharomonospora sp. NPDC046836]|uniref:hypothetical protein n=1 Tax=Saccharomonospora sp. NPDC046836 TaxID=3156921 RepID=UPI0033FCC934